MQTLAGNGNSNLRNGDCVHLYRSLSLPLSLSPSRELLVSYGDSDDYHVEITVSMKTSRAS